MSTNQKIKVERLFLSLFLLVTIFVWSPLGYGSYGTPEIILGMPKWFVVAFIAAVALFILEWVYLFLSPISINDEELEGAINSVRAEG